jgi:hypothetical protein
MAITGLLSTAPTVTPGAGTNSQFLLQYMREYDRLERQWLSSMGQNMVQYPAGRPYTPGPFSQITPAPVASELAPPPSAFAPQGGGAPGGFPGGPMNSINRTPSNAFGATPINRGMNAGLMAGSLFGGPVGLGAGALGLGLTANNIAANQAMRDFYGAPAMTFGQQLGGMFGGGLLGALGIGNSSGLGITPETAQLAYGYGVDRNMDVGPVVSAAPIGSGLAGMFGGAAGYGYGPGESPTAVGGMDYSSTPGADTLGDTGMY